MYTILEYPIALIVAAVVTYFLATTWGERASWHYRGVYDPEGNYGRAYSSAIRQAVLLATGIAGAIKAPAILKAIAEIIAAATTG